MEIRRNSPPQLLGGTIMNLLARFDADGHFGIIRLCRVWPEAVGETIAHRTEVTGVRFGIATVKVSGAMWIQELSLMKPQILEQLRKVLGDDAVADIRFVQGRLSRKEHRRLRALPRNPRRAIDLPAISDPQLRGAFDSLIEAWGRASR